MGKDSARELGQHQPGGTTAPPGACGEAGRLEKRRGHPVRTPRWDGYVSVSVRVYRARRVVY